MQARQTSNTFYTVYVALIVALGGFLMGFDASVISGVVKFIEPEFKLSKIELGWSVASLALTATLAMMVSGPLSDKLGRRPVLRLAALLFTVSAIGSALAPNFIVLVIARMIGGLGVGAALIIAPMYIAEIAPPRLRGRMVSFNQLNIVIGISAAFFTNYLILKLGQSDTEWTQTMMFDEWNWRWMLGLETLPAVLYFLCLYFVPESPRWLIMHGEEEQACRILEKTIGEDEAKELVQTIKTSLEADRQTSNASILDLLQPSMRLVLMIGISIAVLQQITGINSVFFYAPMIFEQSGIGTDASFMQAILVGLTNLVFTLVAISIIDKFGRKPLLAAGITGVAVFMFLLSYGFSTAEYSLAVAAIQELPDQINRAALMPLADQIFTSDLAFKAAIADTLGADAAQQYESELVTAAIHMNPRLILIGILGFVASFAVSLGPVMWVLFSELFPNRIRGIAISFVGLINSAVSFLVQLLFPWQLATLGNSATFMIYGIFAVTGLIIIMKLLPETKGKSLEELESTLVKA